MTVLPGDPATAGIENLTFCPIRSDGIGTFEAPFNRICTPSSNSYEKTPFETAQDRNLLFLGSKGIRIS